MAPRRTNALNRMWNDWRATFPKSNTAQDGWIGDTAHQASTSGHNPDDTSGSKSEYSDADSVAEVRAIDKDSRLNSTVDMQHIINRMLTTPADRDRLAYIIFNRKIWRKKNGWKQETYTGSDPHLLHAHFSGDPAFDEATAEWTSITKATGVVVPTPVEQAALNADNALYHALQGHDPIVGNKSVQSGSPVEFPNILAPMKTAVDATKLAVDVLVARPAAGGLSPAEQEAMAQAIADRVLVVLSQKLGPLVIAAMLDPQVIVAFTQAAFQGAQQAEQQ